MSDTNNNTTNDTKSAVFSMRVPQEFKNLIAINAKSLNMTDKEYVKSCITNAKIDYKPMQKDIVAVERGIRKIGNNINQLTHVLNIARLNGNLSDIEYDKFLDIFLDLKLAMGDISHECN